MNQLERILYLIKKLKNEDDRFKDLEISESYSHQVRLFRSLMNVRMPKEISKEFLQVQDEFLWNETIRKGIVKVTDVSTIAEELPSSSLPFKEKLSIWQGDITRLDIDAIVNAANSQMLGCFAQCHGCIDNAIHSASIQFLSQNEGKIDRAIFNVFKDLDKKTYRDLESV